MPLFYRHHYDTADFSDLLNNDFLYWNNNEIFDREQPIPGSKIVGKRIRRIGKKVRETAGGRSNDRG